MADRYQGKRFPADDYDRSGDQFGSDESDPLAELARLIGQTDPFGNLGKSHQAPPPVPRAIPRDRQEPRYEPPQYDEPQYEEPVEEEPRAAGPPAWMQRANARAVPRRDVPPEQDYPNPVHPLQRYAAQPVAQYEQHQQHQDYQEYSDEPAYEETAEQADPSRYDEALYGQLEGRAQDFQREPAYPDDPYAYQDGYEDESEEPARKRRGGLLTVVAVLALAVVGTGAAFAYRTYMSSPKSGDPPIIKANNTPTKVMPAPADTASKTPDRMPAGDGVEKILSREEKPVDVNANTGAPRVVFPPLTPNGNPPPAAAVAMAAPPPQSAPPVPANGNLPSGEPHRIKTFSVRGDQADAAAVPVPPPAPPAKPTKSVSAAPRPAPQAAATAPLSLAPDAQTSAPAPEPRRVATLQPPPGASGSDAAPPAEGRFLVSITSQPTEAEAQAAFRSMQKKHPDQLGSHSPVIKRVDGKKGVAYRAMVGPFASREEAKQFCTSYSSAGGQCWVP
jgi:hypothetical protein